LLEVEGSTLFENWSELPIDQQRADALLKPILRAGGSGTALICAMLEGLRADVPAVHRESVQQISVEPEQPRKLGAFLAGGLGLAPVAGRPCRFEITRRTLGPAHF